MNTAAEQGLESHLVVEIVLEQRQDLWCADIDLRSNDEHLRVDISSHTQQRSQVLGAVAEGDTEPALRGGQDRMDPGTRKLRTATDDILHNARV